MNFTCKTCKGKVPLSEDDSKFIRCPSCIMKMAKESLQKSIHGTLCFSFNQEKVRLSIFSSTLYTLAIANQLNTSDTEGVEDFFLSHSLKIAFSTEAKIIQNIVHVTNVAGQIVFCTVLNIVYHFNNLIKLIAFVSLFYSLLSAVPFCFIFLG